MLRSSSIGNNNNNSNSAFYYNCYRPYRTLATVHDNSKKQFKHNTSHEHTQGLAQLLRRTPAARPIG